MTSKQRARRCGEVEEVGAVMTRKQRLIIITRSYSGYMEYSIDIFQEDTIKRMVDNIGTLANSVVIDWKQSIQKIIGAG